MRLLITGSRDWDDYDTIVEEITRVILEWVKDHPEYESGPINWFTLVHGGCPRGADFLADRFARDVLKCKIEIYEADWAMHGRSAGIKRNMRMVRSMPDACLAFLRDNSRGTLHCRNAAKAAGIPTETIHYDAEKIRRRDEGRANGEK
jgi:hypothetical protein